MSYQHVFEKIEKIQRVHAGLVLFAAGVEEEWIKKAEGALGVRFPPSFAHYLRQYGGATIGGETVNGLLGVDFEDACGPDVVYNTLLDRESRHLDQGLLVLVDNDGDEFFYLDTNAKDSDGENPVVRELAEARGERHRFASSFADFLLKRVEFALAGR